MAIARFAVTSVPDVQARLAWASLRIINFGAPAERVGVPGAGIMACPSGGVVQGGSHAHLRAEQSEAISGQSQGYGRRTQDIVLAGVHLEGVWGVAVLGETVADGAGAGAGGLQPRAPFHGWQAGCRPSRSRLRGRWRRQVAGPVAGPIAGPGQQGTLGGRAPRAGPGEGEEAQGGWRCVIAGCRPTERRAPRPGLLRPEA